MADLLNRPGGQLSLQGQSPLFCGPSIGLLSSTNEANKKHYDVDAVNKKQRAGQRSCGKEYASHSNQRTD